MIGAGVSVCARFGERIGPRVARVQVAGVEAMVGGCDRMRGGVVVYPFYSIVHPNHYCYGRG
jgi:hypothetical protein